MIDGYRIGFIGTGNMGQAVLMGVINNKLLSKKNIYAFDINKQIINELNNKIGINIVKSNIELAKKSDMIVLAVKPHICCEVLKEIGKALKGKALLSIVSGWSLQEIKNHVDETCRIQVIQPNMPLTVGKGITLMAKSTTLSTKELIFVKEIFNSLGVIERVEDNLLMFYSTVSAASPAFIYMFIESLVDASVKDGIKREIAYKLCSQAILGAAKMMLENRLHPADLKDKITSPGGSTIRGVYELEKTGFRGSIMSAVNACNDRWRR